MVWIVCSIHVLGISRALFFLSAPLCGGDHRNLKMDSGALTLFCDHLRAPVRLGPRLQVHTLDLKSCVSEVFRMFHIVRVCVPPMLVR